MPATEAKLQQGEESRQRLIDSATALISDGGYAGTSVDAIARRAGVVKSALYWHFGSKRGLLLEAIRVETEAWVTEAFGAARAVGAPMARLDDLMDRVESVIAEGSRAQRMMLALLLELGADDEEVRESVAEVFDVTRRALSAGLGDSLQGLGPEAAEDIAEAFTAQVDGLMLRQLAAPDGPRLRRSLRMLRRMVLLAIEHELDRGGDGP